MKIRITLALAALLVQGVAVSAAEIKVLSAGAIRPSLQELIPQFEQVSGHKVSITFVGGPAVKQQIEGGAAFDLAISNGNVMDELAKAGKLAATTRTDLARWRGRRRAGWCTEADISTVDAFKRTLQREIRRLRGRRLVASTSRECSSAWESRRKSSRRQGRQYPGTRPTARWLSWRAER